MVDKLDEIALIKKIGTNTEFNISFLDIITIMENRNIPITVSNIEKLIDSIDWNYLNEQVVELWTNVMVDKIDEVFSGEKNSK